MATRRHRYVALLRAINVGGHSTIKMAELRELFESLGFTSVSTYIQTGNVVFDAEESDRRRLVELLEDAIEDRFGYRSDAFLLTVDELRRAAANDPFASRQGASERLSHVLFLSAQPAPFRLEVLNEKAGDQYQFELGDRVLYYAYPRQLAGRRRTINFEKLLGVRGTARTSKVVRALVELAS